MKLSSSQLLLLSTAYLGANALPSGGTLVQRQNSDSEVIAHFSTTGSCFSYVQGNNMQKSLAPCNTWCKKTHPGASGVTCISNVPQSAWKKDPTMLQKDSDGNLWLPGNCQCGGTVAALTDDIMGAVFKGLRQLDHVMCAVLLQSFTLMAQIGENFIPVEGEINAVKAAVESAKTMAENALGGSGLDSWVSQACGVQNFKSDTHVYSTLTNMPDAYGKSIGCKQTDKSKCKPVPAVPGKIKVKDSKTPPKNTKPKAPAPKDSKPKPKDTKPPKNDPKNDKPKPKPEAKPKATKPRDEIPMSW